jgi:outer membrane protein assembly factor BamD (BamD/ComL family)
MWRRFAAIAPAARTDFEEPMSDVPKRFDHVRRLVQAGAALGVAAAAGVIVIGIVLTVSGPEAMSAPLLTGAIAIAAGAVVIALCISIWGMVSLLIKMEANSWRSHDVLRDMHALVEENQRHLTVIAENVQLSEAARSISHRSKERTVLRLAINDEIVRGDWEAAYALVEQLEARHGYKNEAARLRAELDQSRQLSREHKVHDAVEAIKSHMEAHDWDRARREMDQLVATFPENVEIKELPRAFARKRDEHKRRLLKAWDESVQRNEIDRGIMVLKELDQFLTPNEAAALRESARGVFRAKLHNLGVQFSLAVTESQWQEALRIGRQIVEEFPNTRMAAEVKERIPVLSKRAAEATEEPVAEHA